MKNLVLSNTLTKQKDIFIPLIPNKVSLYVCGITPYDFAHLGHGRCYVVFDLLFRLFKFLGYDVTYVRNFTDIDDKLVVRSEKEFGDSSRYKDVADKFIASFKDDMHKLNCLNPTYEPLVTENISQIISFVQGLIEKNVAYVLGNDVYFDISKFEEYGKLSGRNIEDLLAGARVSVDVNKRNPQDFALWKGNEEGSYWKSPWGYGRPGWHIECSALAKKYLGETIDIHGGGMDLIFPHHENEIAQSEGLSERQFAKFWIHNAFVNINKEKMSKSLGNFFTLKDIFQKYDPMVLRFFYLQHQYKTPIEFSFELLESAQRAYKKLIEVFHVKGGYKATFLIQNLEKYSVASDMLSALSDDLNSPKLLGILFENLSEIKKVEDLKVVVGSFLFNVLGLTFDKLKEEKIEITPEIQSIIDQRNIARSEKNWKVADELRDKLVSMGIEIKDIK